MERNTSKKAWFAILKGSIVPVLLGVFAVYSFIVLYEKYGSEHGAIIAKAFFSLLIVLITYWAFRISDTLFLWYAVNVAAKTKTKLDDKFMPLFRRVSSTVIWSIGIVVLLAKLGVNINALIATLGVGSLAIAMAAQDTIANIIAGFLIMLDSPFSIDDEIKLASGEKVKVLDIGIRRSKFLSEENAVIIMPNLELSKSKITNYTQSKNV